MLHKTHMSCFDSLKWPYCHPDESEGVYECSDYVNADSSLNCCLSTPTMNKDITNCPLGWASNPAQDEWCTDNYDVIEDNVYRHKCHRVLACDNTLQDPKTSCTTCINPIQAFSATPSCSACLSENLEWPNCTSCQDGDFDNNNLKCGEEKKPCDPGYRCEKGRCNRTCLTGFTACGTGCFDTSTDTQHCGGCDACPPLRTCRNSSCVCNAGLTLCSGNCIDTKNDDNMNCGGCGTPCNNGRCIKGNCTPCEFYEEYNSATGKCQCINEVDGECIFVNIKSATYANNVITIEYNVKTPNIIGRFDKQLDIQNAEREGPFFDGSLPTSVNLSNMGYGQDFVPTVCIVTITDRKTGQEYISKSCVRNVSDTCTGKAPVYGPECIDFSSSVDNCGSCFKRCFVTEECTNSKCVEVGCRGISKTPDGQCVYGLIRSGATESGPTESGPTESGPTESGPTSLTVDLKYDVIVPNGYSYYFRVLAAPYVQSNEIFSAQTGTDVTNTVTFTFTDPKPSKIAVNMAVVPANDVDSRPIYDSGSITIQCKSDDLDPNTDCYFCKDPTLVYCQAEGKCAETCM
jgi:hypothetical protein